MIEVFPNHDPDHLFSYFNYHQGNNFIIDFKKSEIDTNTIITAI